MPLLFPRLLCQVLKHIGFSAEPKLERRRDCEAILTVDRWQIMLCSYHLPPPGPAEDQAAVDIPTEEQSPTAEHIGEPQASAPSIPAAPTTTAPVPPAPLPSVSPRPSAPSTTYSCHSMGDLESTIFIS